MMTDRMYLIGQALAGLIANPTIRHKDGGTATSRDMANAAVELATAALAAAGEKESAFRDLYSVTINGVEYSTTNKALVDEIARLRAELDKREGMVQIPTADWRRLTLLVYACGGKGSGPVDEIHAIIAKVEAQS
jgi:hypothetical protein